MNLDSITKILVIIIIALLICTLLMLGAWGVVALVTDTPLFDSLGTDKPAQQTQADTGDVPTNTTPDPSVSLGESADMGQDYIDSIIFLGDSRTYHMKNRGVLTGGKDTKQTWSGYDPETNYASGTLMLDGMIHKTKIYHELDGTPKTIAEAVAAEKPKYLFISLGFNGLASAKENSFIAYYGKLIESVRQASPETKIVLQSIYPVTEAYAQGPSGITNDKIETANTWIMKVAEQNGCKFIDTASVLKNDRGVLIASYATEDGYHLTKEAYVAILQYIRTHGYTD